MQKIGDYEIKRIEAYKTSDTYDSGVIMGIHPSQNCPQRYATWEYTESHETGNISAFWGHYYENETDAYKDFYERLASHYDKPWED